MKFKATIYCTSEIDECWHEKKVCQIIKSMDLNDLKNKISNQYELGKFKLYRNIDGSILSGDFKEKNNYVTYVIRLSNNNGDNLCASKITKGLNQ